jgi:hypothetical protein
VAYEAPPTTTGGTTELGKDTASAPQYVPSLTRGIKKLITPACSGGASHTAGIYATAWHHALPTLDKAASAHMWTDTGVTWAQLKLTLKARWG